MISSRKSGERLRRAASGPQLSTTSADQADALEAFAAAGTTLHAIFARRALLPPCNVERSHATMARASLDFHDIIVPPAHEYRPGMAKEIAAAAGLAIIQYGKRQAGT